MTEHKGGQPKQGQEQAAPRGASLGGPQESGGISFGTRPAKRPDSFPPSAKVGPEYYDRLDEIRGSRPFSEFRTEGRVPVAPVERLNPPETTPPVHLTEDQRANPGVNPVVGQEYYDSLDAMRNEGPFQGTSRQIGHIVGLTAAMPGAAAEIWGPEGLKAQGRVLRDEVLNKEALKETGSNVVDAVVDGAHAAWSGWDVEKTRLQITKGQDAHIIPGQPAPGWKKAEEVTETVHRPGIKDAGKGIADKTVDLAKGYKKAFKEEPGQTVRRTSGVVVGATAAIWGFTAFADFVNTSPEERAEAAAAARTPDTAIVAPVVPGAENAVPCRTQGISNTEAICDTRDGEIIVNIGEPPFGDTDDNGYGTVSAMGESYGNGIDFSGYGQSELNPGDTMRVPLEAEEGDHPGYDVFVQRHQDDAEKPYGVSILDQSGRPPAVG